MRQSLRQDIFPGLPNSLLGIHADIERTGDIESLRRIRELSQSKSYLPEYNL